MGSAYHKAIICVLFGAEGNICWEPMVPRIELTLSVVQVICWEPMVQRIELTSVMWLIYWESMVPRIQLTLGSAENPVSNYTLKAIALDIAPIKADQGSLVCQVLHRSA